MRFKKKHFSKVKMCVDFAKRIDDDDDSGNSLRNKPTSCAVIRYNTLPLD